MDAKEPSRMDKLTGKGRAAIELIADDATFKENFIDGIFVCADIAPGAVVGTGCINGQPATIISIDAMAPSGRFPVIYAGIIGLEEGYKMAMAVYDTIKLGAVAEASPAPGSVINSPGGGNAETFRKRPIVLIVDTPGNGPGKTEEIFGMNKSTGAYQLALAEARQHGHPVVAVVIGRAISGAFLCHGLQADRILALSKDFGTIIHVMPLSSIARITKLDIETLEELSKSNPVFASGADYFYKLGGIDEIIEGIDDIKPAVVRHIEEIHALHNEKASGSAGPWHRGRLGEIRGGRTARAQVLKKMAEEFELVKDLYN